MQNRRTIIKLGTAAGFAAVLGIPLSLLRAEPKSLGIEGKFLKACNKGDLDKVKLLLQRSPILLDVKDQLGRSGFALALLSGHQVIADFLKEKGYQSDLHETALALDWERFNMLLGEETEQTQVQVDANHPIGGNTMWAAAAGGAGSNIWRVYAQCGNPNSLLNNQGTTPLQKALRYPDLARAEMTAANLLGNNGDPNLVGQGDWSPLAIAAARGSEVLVEMLIRKGAKIDWTNSKGKSALNLAEKYGHEPCWELLKKHQTVARTCQSSREAYSAQGEKYQLPDFKGIPLFLRRRMVGKSHGDFDYVKQAIAKDPRMAHSVATTGEKSIEACAHLNRKPIVELLLKKGAPYSLPTAVMMNDFSTVKRLLNQDPLRIHERGPHDFALLWYPIIGRCDLEMMQLLLDRGAKVEEQHYLGTTALHWACQRGPIEVVALLVESGADVNRIGRKFKAEGETPLQRTKDEKIKDYLKSKGAR